MPGYIMHLCEGQSILDMLNITFDSHPDAARDFMLGTVIPDAVDYKTFTHFRPSWQRDLITKYPDIHDVMQAFSASGKTPADCGILAHLLMDSLYVTDFWPQYFDFENVSGIQALKTAEIDHVRMKAASMQPENSVIDFGRFFSSEYFYGDYDLTNAHFIRDFHPYIPEVRPCEITIAGFDKYKPSKLRADLECFSRISEPRQKIGKPVTHIFPYDDMKVFVRRCAEEFADFKPLLAQVISP